VSVSGDAVAWAGEASRSNKRNGTAKRGMIFPESRQHLASLADGRQRKSGATMQGKLDL
jgi:hypothetical protein